MGIYYQAFLLLYADFAMVGDELLLFHSGVRVTVGVKGEEISTLRNISGITVCFVDRSLQIINILCMHIKKTSFQETLLKNSQMLMGAFNVVT